VPFELDLRGLRRDEAIERLESGTAQDRREGTRVSGRPIGLLHAKLPHRKVDGSM